MSTPPADEIIILILAGGLSTRMTAPKHLLPCPSLHASPPGAELCAYLHLLRTARHALTLAATSAQAVGGDGTGDGDSDAPAPRTKALLSLRTHNDGAGADAVTLPGLGDEWTAIFDDDADEDLFPAPSPCPLLATSASHTGAGGAATVTAPAQRADNRTISKDTNRDIGPALGLLHAHTLYPFSTLLVIATDYLLLEAHDIARLLLLSASHPAAAPPTADEADEADSSRTRPAITVFRNVAGHLEPLVGVWTPEALEELRRAVRRGKTGPVGVVRGLVEGGKGCVVPWDEKGCNGYDGGELGGGRGSGGCTGVTRLDNINTPAEWAGAQKVLRARAAAYA